MERLYLEKDARVGAVEPEVAPAKTDALLEGEGIHGEVDCPEDNEGEPCGQ